MEQEVQHFESRFHLEFCVISSYRVICREKKLKIKKKTIPVKMTMDKD